MLARGGGAQSVPDQVAGGRAPLAEGQGTPGDCACDFTDLAEVQQRLIGFQARYGQVAIPFDWRYTRADLDRLLQRLDEHEHLTAA